MSLQNSQQDNLSRIKKFVETTHIYFRENYERFNDCRRFVFKSSLSNDAAAAQRAINHPQLTFNRLEAYISRLLGEFSKQEPDIQVSAYEDQSVDGLTLKIIEQHLKHVFSDPSNENLRYAVYKDALSGGFSAVKVMTDYEHEMSMNQIIKFKKCEPTLTGFDPLAVLPSKGDGRFCFELFPKSKNEFEAEFPNVDLKTVSFKRNFGGFNWSFANNVNDKTLLVVDFYEKKFKEETIVQLALPDEEGNISSGPVMFLKEYNQLCKELEELDPLMPPPAILNKRKTKTQKIIRTRLIEDKIIDSEETDFEMLPIVFIDGNSLMLSGQDNNNITQFTRPYVWNALDAQRFVDYAGNAWAFELQNSVAHKFMVAKEALPKEETFLNAYKDIQNASTLVYNSCYENDPNLPIMNPIREVQRMPMPPEISGAFMSADQTIQSILGSYDASLGINDNQLSGVAIIEGATQSNAAAMPYIVSCLEGFERLAQIYVNLLPKYYTNERVLPFLDKDSKQHKLQINTPEGLPLDKLNGNALKVSLKAGSSFAVEKTRTMNTIKDLMSVSPLFAEFIGTQGIPFLLDHVNGLHIDDLKEKVEQWQQQREQQAKQQAQQPNPEQLKAQINEQRLQLEKQAIDNKQAIDIARLQLEQEKLAINTELTDKSLEIQAFKAQIEGAHKHDDTMVKHINIEHRNTHEHNKLNHDMLKHISQKLSKG
jgi:hypothetical protein